MDDFEDDEENRRTCTIDYQVRVEVDEETGNTVLQIWMRDGLIHREDGPAIVRFDHLTLHKLEEHWMRNGGLHRDDDEPAWSYYDINDESIHKESYHKNGELHREGDKPARISYRVESGGQVAREEYWLNGKLHRDQGPAIIVYDRETGDVMWVKYYKQGYELSVPDAKPFTP